MKSKLLKMALTWLAPIVIVYFVNKFEERVNTKQTKKAIKAS